MLWQDYQSTGRDCGSRSRKRGNGTGDGQCGEKPPGVSRGRLGHQRPLVGSAGDSLGILDRCCPARLLLNCQRRTALLTQDVQRYCFTTRVTLLPAMFVG